MIISRELYAGANVILIADVVDVAAFDGRFRRFQVLTFKFHRHNP